MTEPAGPVRAGVRLLRATPVLLILTITTLALWRSPVSLERYWREILDYQHGYLIAAIALAWIGRELWSGACHSSRPSLVAMLLLIPVLLAWVVAVRSSIEVAHQLLWPVAMCVAVWAVAGRQWAWRLLPAIGLLYFAIPVWDYGLPVLQRLSIFFSEHILEVLGVPATVSEYRVTIPEGTFEIVEGCSGKRYFVVTLAIACLAVAIYRLRGRRVPLFLALAGLLSMLMNWIRIVIVIYAGHVSDMQHYLVVNEHKSLGNVLFVVLIVAVLVLGRWLAGRQTEPTADTAPALDSAISPSHLRSATLIAVLLLLLAMLAGHASRAATPMRIAALPIATGGWTGPLPPRAAWRPDFMSPDDERRVAYSSAQGTIELYANLFSDQGEGRELIQYGNNIVAPALWSESWGLDRESLDSGGRTWATRQMEGPDGRLWLVTYAYQVGGGVYRSELGAKLAYGWRSIIGAAPSGVLAAASSCDARNCNNARKLLSDFWNNMWPSSEALIPAGTAAPR